MAREQHSRQCIAWSIAVTAVIAIDPGLTGAIALYDGASLLLTDIPTETRGKRTAVDLPVLWRTVREWAPWPHSIAGVVENVGAMPMQGLGSAANFGKTIGACEMALVAAGCTLVRVTPQTWKFGVGIAADSKADTKARKNASRARAIELFPNYAHLFARVKDDGRAEAALMAWWFVHKRPAAALARGEE
jgi:crossover junction endodeoxyribonuclease RuvC